MFMKTKKGIYQSFLISLLLILGVFLMIHFSLNANAASGDFKIEKEILSTSINQNSIVQFTITNDGKDFDGTFRFMCYGHNNSTIAFDTPLSLADGSTKQFTVTIPSFYLINISNQSRIMLVNKKDKVLYTESFNNDLFVNKDTLNLGILSDNYNALTFMDCAGDEFNFYSQEYVITLKEINEQNLIKTLPSLTYLVIDNYHTDILTEQDYNTLYSWVHDGGILILGTGENQDMVLSESFINFLSLYQIDSFFAKEAFGDEIITYSLPISKPEALSFANLDIDNSHYKYDLDALTYGTENGQILICNYALSDLPDAFSQNGVNETSLNNFTYNMLDFVTRQSNSRFIASASYATGSLGNTVSRYMTAISNTDNKINFKFLEIIIVIYCICISPILYLVLKKMGRQEKYWILVPILSFSFIIVIYFCSNGISVNKIKSYTITSIDSTGQNQSETILYGYDSKKKTYSIQLNDQFNAACPIPNTGGYTSTNNTEVYNEKVTYDSEGIILTKNPESSFDGLYYYLESDMTAKGDFSYNTTQVTNNTGFDLDYILIYDGGNFDVYKGCSDNNSISLSSSKALLNGYYSDFMNSYNSAVKKSKKSGKVAFENSEEMLALGYAGTRLMDEYPSYTIIVGIISDYDEKITDTKSGLDFGCVYTLIP